MRGREAASIHNELLAKMFSSPTRSVQPGKTRPMTAPRPYHPYATISPLSAALTAYHEGWLDDEEINHLLFLVDSGLDCSLPGCFGRLVDDLIGLADDLIEAGDVSLT